MKKKYSVSIGLDFENTKRFKGFENMDDAVAFINKNGQQSCALWKHHEDRPIELVRIYVFGEAFIKFVV